MSKEKDYLKMVEGSANAWANLPALVRQIKDDALTILANNLEDLFSNCDDLFFDLSSRAASNSEQNLYFESMRELRFKKAGVISAFRQNFEQNFLTFVKVSNANGSRGNSSDPTSADSLTLVQNDTLEQEVAISSMVSKARINCQEALYHLATRLDYLIPKVSIDQDNNPLDPQQVCCSFAQACELFDISIKAKIIIFKQFDRLVASKLIKIYTSANELLINAGVLPKISRSVQKQADSTASADIAATTLEAAAQVAAATQQLQFDFSELSNLLASMRRLGLTQLPNYTAYSANPGPVMSSVELAALLTQQQHPHSDQPNETIDLRQLVNVLLTAGNPNMPRALQQPDEDVINLVAMFFDFVLDDRNLPITVQALISRLQIPILKVALRDKGFFSHANHPARKLINTIADASIGWDESEQPSKDKLHNKIAEIVQTISDQYADNEQVFMEKLTDLQQFVQQEEHRTSLVERRTSQAIEGQAKTQQAKTLVQQLLFSRLEKMELPPAISSFLIGQWQQLLVLIHLRHGEESPEWLEAMQLVDDLVWASCRHDDPRSLQRLSKIRPELLQRIAQGLSKIAITAEASQSAIRAIGEVLDQLQAKAPVDFKTISAEQAIALGHTPGSGSKSWQEMTALERQQARYKALTYEFIKKADTMPIGTWLSYEDSRRGKILRCKLASKIEVSDTFVFVNRFGFKVMEKARKDFAYDMQQHRANVLDNGALFDRAMDNIVTNLRQISKTAS